MILINASNLYVGGGVQVAVSLLNEFTKSLFEFKAVVSPVVYDQLSIDTRVKCIIINQSPSKLFNFADRKKLDEIVKENNIKIVLTIFGPSYWSPKNVKHIVGFALPWLIFANHNLYAILNLKEKIKFLLLKYLQPYFYKKNADYIITESKAVSEKVQSLLHFDNQRVFTISNTLNDNFRYPALYDNSILDKLPIKNKDDFWLLTITHDYPHKNMKVIIRLLDKLPRKFKFITTLPESFKEELTEEKKERIITIGRVNNNQCPPLYNACDAMFLPTLLECFSASYLEALFMKKMVITSDRDFSRAVCDKHAFYFDPCDVDDICNKIKEASMLSTTEKQSFTESAFAHGNSFLTAQERAGKYIELLAHLR
ncbi:glycosyltransferase [Trabulsiella odontotermitis]|uniref:glycosyltransferase n=1 Tax=Trabulsiella odontotermitis TaxID=379893 RepID=UPI000676631E|nr:glycosyltransferase [Trabulsiella odontotermitis]KNC91477.1 hypothetical protein GM30_22535 [Trabulsiella odontotermitis]